MQIASTLREAGMDFVDAPVSGGVWASEEGRLIVMQGGHPDACERANQVIECYAKMITRVGDVGHGQIAKLSNQIAQTITIEGVAECLTFAKNLGARSSGSICSDQRWHGWQSDDVTDGSKMIAEI